MKLEDLEKLAAEYLETLDDTYKDEWYTTELNFNRYGIENFIQWLRENK